MRRVLLIFISLVVVFMLSSVSLLAAAPLYDLELEVGDTLYPGRYRFNDVIVGGPINPDSVNGSYSLQFPFYSNGQPFNYFSVYFGASHEERYFRLIYYQPNSFIPYTVDNGWDTDYQIIDIYDPYLVSDELRCDFLNSNLKLMYRYGSGDGLAYDIFSLFDEISLGIVSLFPLLISIFYVSGSFTFFGVLLVISLAIAVSLLFFFLILRFIRLRR